MGTQSSRCNEDGGGDRGGNSINKHDEELRMRT